MKPQVNSRFFYTVIPVQILLLPWMCAHATNMQITDNTLDLIAEYAPSGSPTPNPIVDLAHFILPPENTPAAFKGYCDYRALFAEPIAFQKAINVLTLCWQDKHITHVCAFSLVGGLIAGALATRIEAPQLFWTDRSELGNSDNDTVLRFRPPHTTFRTGDRILFVHDVLSTGNMFVRARNIIERRGASVAGLAVIAEVVSLGARARFSRPVAPLTKIEH